MSFADATVGRFAADVGSYLRAADIRSDYSVTSVPGEDSLVLRFEVLGQPETLRFSAKIDPRDIGHAAWLLREQRLAAVGPEFHMATQLAARPFDGVDPYGRPA